MVGFVIIRMRFQYDLLALFVTDQLVICLFSIAQKDSGFIDPRRKGFFDILSTWISSIDATYNDAPIPVSSNANTEMLIGKATFCCCFTMPSGFSGGYWNPFLGFQYIRLVCLHDTLQQFAIFESFLQEGQELVAHIEGGRVRAGKVAQASSV